MSNINVIKYFDEIKKCIESILETEMDSIAKAASAIANQVEDDRIVYIYGPGGHSNLGAQELFFRAGGLMHISAILDEGTLLSGGALRSMAIERMAGYGNIVLQNYGLKEGDLLIIVNAYGINAATIDAALEAKRLGVHTIGVSSFSHAELTPREHPARHPTKGNLHSLVDIALDSKIKIGDAVVSIANLEQKVGALSTFANAFLLNSIVIDAISILVKKGITPPIWMSGNATGGDEWNQQFIDRFKTKIKKL